MTQKPSERIEEIARELAYNDAPHSAHEMARIYSIQCKWPYYPRATIMYLDEEAEKKRPSVAELAKKHGFPDLSEEEKQASFDLETSRG